MSGELKARVNQSLNSQNLWLINGCLFLSDPSKSESSATNVFKLYAAERIVRTSVKWKNDSIAFFWVDRSGFKIEVDPLHLKFKTERDMECFCQGIKRLLKKQEIPACSDATPTLLKTAYNKDIDSSKKVEVHSSKNLLEYILL